MKILVVDDQPDVVAGILDGVNWRALHVEKAYSALSAAEAKDLLLREKIDILLCDIEMPGESGLSLVAWLQKQGRETKGSTAQLLRQALSNHPSGRKP